jgi:hypothetical protein
MHYIGTRPIGQTAGIHLMRLEHARDASTKPAIVGYGLRDVLVP